MCAHAGFFFFFAGWLGPSNEPDVHLSAARAELAVATIGVAPWVGRPPNDIGLAVYEFVIVRALCVAVALYRFRVQVELGLGVQGVYSWRAFRVRSGARAEARALTVP